MATRSDRSSPALGLTLPPASWPPASRIRPALPNRPSLDPVAALSESLSQTQILGEQALPEELIRSNSNYPELNSPYPELNDITMNFLYGSQISSEFSEPKFTPLYADQLTRDKPPELQKQGSPLTTLKRNTRNRSAHVRKLVL